MRAITLNEMFNSGLKIYKDKSGSYSAKRDSILYSFLWNPYKVFNFKKVGKINNTYNISGKLIHNPPIQMILQIQKNINVNESLNDVFKYKSDQDIIKKIYKLSQDELDRQLQIAVWKGMTKLTELLINNGANVNRRDIFGDTPLDNAKYTNNKDIVELLIKSGAKLGRFNLRESLNDVFKSKSIDDIKRSISKLSQFQLNQKLIDFLHEGNKEMVKLLIEFGADVNCKTDNDISALMIASANGFLGIMQIMIDKNAFINDIDDTRLTPLNYAIGNWQNGAVKLLLKNGAAVNNYALQQAIDDENEELINLLKSYGDKE